MIHLSNNSCAFLSLVILILIEQTDSDIKIFSRDINIEHLFSFFFPESLHLCFRVDSDGDLDGEVDGDLSSPLVPPDVGQGEADYCAVVAGVADGGGTRPAHADDVHGSRTRGRLRTELDRRE